MNDILQKIVFIFLQLSGHFAFKYDRNRKTFVKSNWIYIYSVILTILMFIAYVTATVLIFDNALSSGSDKVRFDLIITNLCSYGAFFVILYEKIFQNSEFVDIYSRLCQLYMSQHNAMLYLKRNQIGTIFRIFMYYIILPLGYATLNIIFIATIVDNKEELICITFILIIVVWFFFSLLPIILAFWMLRNILHFLQSDISSIGDESNTKSNNLSHISVIYDEITNLIKRLTNLFGFHILINLFLMFFHLVYNSYLALFYIVRGLNFTTNFSFSESFAYLVSMFYYTTLIGVIILSAEGLRHENTMIISHLQIATNNLNEQKNVNLN